MKKDIGSYFQVYLVFFIWFLAGYINKWIPFGLIPITVLIFYRKEFYKEILFGFIFILILSDCLEYQVDFAKTFKNVYIVLLSLLVLLDANIRSELTDYFKIFIPFFLVAALCLFYSPVPGTGIQKTISYFLLFFSVPAYVIFVFKNEGTEFVKGLVVFLMVILLTGIFFAYVSPDVAVSHGGRLRGIFGNPNGLGVFVVLVAVIMLIGRKMYGEIFHRYIWWAVWIIIFYCAFKSGSRTALIAIIALLIFIRVSAVSQFLTVLLFISLVIGTEFFLMYSVDITTTLGLQNVFRVDTLDEGSGRFVAWYFAWDNIQRSVFLGQGFAYDEFLMRSNFDFLSRLGHEGGVHNTYLIIWLNTGLVGLVLFLRGFFLGFVKAAKKSSLAVPVMLTVMFSINFEPWLASSLNPFTILFLIAITMLSNDVFYEKTIDYENEISAE